MPATNKTTTAQEKFWTSEFGKEYIKRNNRSKKDLDKFYIAQLGISRSSLNTDFLDNLKLKNILEVGCNVGNQLSLLQSQGFKNLYGVEIFDKAVEIAKQTTRDLNIVRGSGFDIPFKDSYFDLVYTSGVLIHIHPKNIKDFMAEVFRTSKKYIWGVEFYNPEHIHIEYRGNNNYHWKGDFAQMYLDNVPGLKLIKERRYEKIKGKIWSSFLLKKV